MLEAWKKVNYVSNPEYKIPVRLKCVQGHLPLDAKGTYYKNTPHPRAGQFFLDGDGQVSKYTIRNGQVYYSSRTVMTTHVAREHIIGRWLYNGAFGARGILPMIKNVSNTNVIKWGGQLISFYEGGAPYELDECLHTRGLYKGFADGWPIVSGNKEVDAMLKDTGIIGDAVCAHPKIIDDRLVLIKQQYNTDMECCLIILEIDKNHDVVSTKSYWLNSFNYIHDFDVTDDYYIIHHHNYIVNFNDCVSNGVANGICSDKGKEVSQFIIIDRKTGKMNQVNVPGNFWISHYARCKKNKNNILDIDFIEYPNYIRLGHVDTIANVPRGYFTRISIDTRTMTFIDSQRNNVWIEFPIGTGETIYAVGGVQNPQEGICRIHNGNIVDSYTPGKQLLFSEPFIFDSMLGVLCYSALEEKTTLQFFDSNKLIEGPKAIFEYPTKIVSLGLHGSSSV